MPSVNIRPCSPCAHDRCHLIELDDQLGDAYAVTCDECGARGPMDTDADSALLKGNMRYAATRRRHIWASNACSNAYEYWMSAGGVGAAAPARQPEEIVRCNTQYAACGHFGVHLRAIANVAVLKLGSDG